LGTKVLLPHWQEPTECYCREMTIDEINDVVKKYATSAVNARRAGFDFVEVHACHGHNLCDQFFSPLDNRRSDMYGGGLTGRMRFSLEVALSIRKAVGSDYPIFWRLSPEFWGGKGLPGGANLADNIILAVELAKNGIDVIDVSFGHEASSEFPPYRSNTLLTADEPMGKFVEIAAAIRKEADIPVVAVGRIHRPEVAEEILLEEKADLIALGRQLLADPYWPNKVREGLIEDIRPCLSCNTCLETLESGKSIQCVVNASLGKEKEPNGCIGNCSKSMGTLSASWRDFSQCIYGHF
jgi:2,4-dienoyl-CoA reductase (NADPH2)